MLFYKKNVSNASLQIAVKLQHHHLYFSSVRLPHPPLFAVEGQFPPPGLILPQVTYFLPSEFWPWGGMR